MADIMKVLSARPHYDRAMHFMEAGQFHQAVQQLLAALSIIPGEPTYLYWCGWARLHIGDFAGAQLDFAAAVPGLFAVLPTSPDPALVHEQLSFAYAQLGQLDNALFHIRAAIALTPIGHLFLRDRYQRRGLLYLGLGEFEHLGRTEILQEAAALRAALRAAEQDFAAALQAQPPLTAQAQLYALKGRACLKLGQLAAAAGPSEIAQTRAALGQAIQDLSAALNRPPFELDWLYYRGLAYLGLADFAAAAADFDTVIELLQPVWSTPATGSGPSLAQVHYKRAQARHALNDFAGAAEDLSLVMAELSSPAADLYHKRGLCYLEIGRYAEAEADFTTALATEPNAAIYNRRGCARQNLGRHPEAIQDFDNALRLAPEFTQALYNKLMSAFEIGQYELAVEVATQGLALNPDRLQRASLHFYLGLSHFYLRQFAHAIDHLTTCIVLSPQPEEVEGRNPAGAYVMRGLSHANQGEHEEALSDYETALSLDANGRCGSACYFNMATALSRLDRHQEAIDALNLGLEINPQDVEALITRGWEHYHLGDLDAAMDDFQAAEDAATVPVDCSIFLGFGHCLDAKGLTDQAIAQYSRAIEQSEMFAALYSRALCHLKQEGGDVQQALADLTRCIELRPNWGRAYAARAEAYRLLADEVEIADEQEALRLDALADQDEAAAVERGWVEPEDEEDEFRLGPDEDGDDQDDVLQRYLDAQFGSDSWKDGDWGDGEDWDADQGESDDEE